LYWGSGWNWVNGHCLFAELNPDMASFATEPRDITPPNYFEGPFMFKRAGRYYLTYSEGKTTDDTYKVRYAVADAPAGPFLAEGANSPILSTDASRQILGPGHHCIFTLAGVDYIAYHRHARPFDAKELRRQICFDRITLAADGSIERIQPTDEGVEFAPLAR
ncbi:MAG TPA: family 43 glycosylhydrolase, partial [Lacipirellulaceae bacterium]|nr:family 43 glycosylhydrolase [Lacipirellulaceae bacterium]